MCFFNYNLFYRLKGITMMNINIYSISSRYEITTRHDRSDSQLLI